MKPGRRVGSGDVPMTSSPDPRQLPFVFLDEVVPLGRELVRKGDDEQVKKILKVAGPL